MENIEEFQIFLILLDFPFTFPSMFFLCLHHIFFCILLLFQGKYRYLSTTCTCSSLSFSCSSVCNVKFHCFSFGSVLFSGLAFSCNFSVFECTYVRLWMKSIQGHHQYTKCIYLQVLLWNTSWCLLVFHGWLFSLYSR